MAKHILVTGGAGFIGSHAVIDLIEAGFDVTVLDNLVNSSEESLKRVAKIVGRPIPFYKVDLIDRAKVEEVFDAIGTPFAVIHFAGLKAVGESKDMPLYYYHNNVTGSLVLFEVMAKRGCKNLIFSSSATVYGDLKEIPCTEITPLGEITNPYGKTKYFIEEILRDLYYSDKNWNIVLLRYFNPVGAHESGMIGEDPQGIPNNLMPFIAQTAVGKREKLTVLGHDYPTRDGTGIRDFIHVVDLVKGHTAALRKIEATPTLGCKVYNLGCGNGISVLELVAAFEKASGKKVPYVLGDRRPGDVGEVWCNPEKAFKELGWKAQFDVDRMCQDAWRWQSGNPNGYKDA